MSRALRIEDKISDALDAAGNGLVEYVSDTVYVTQQADSVRREFAEALDWILGD